MSNINFPEQYKYSGFKANNLTLVCINIPPHTNSYGMLASKRLSEFSTYPLPLLELQIFVIFIFANAFHYMLKPLGASSFVSCLFAGVVLGPTFLGQFEFTRKWFFPHESQDRIMSLALLGYSLFLFLSGVKMDVGMVLRTGTKALSIGVLSVTLPLVLGLIYVNSRAEYYLSEVDFLASWCLTLIHAITCFPVTSYMISHQLKISHSELGRLSLCSSLVAELLGIITIIAFNLVDTGLWVLVVRYFKYILFFVLALIFILRPAMNWVIRKTPESKPISSFYIYVILAIALGSEIFFSCLRQVQFLGPFIVGLAVPAGAPLGSAFEEKFGSFTVAVLFEILTVTSMMRADLFLVISEYYKLKKYIKLILITCGTKLLSSLFPSMIARVPLVDSMALSFIMNYKGIVELCLAVIFRDTRMISEEIFALVALSILLNAAIIPVIVKFFYNPSRKYAGYQTRNITSLKPNAELKVLACVHRPDNVASIIKLLDASYPTKDRPIGVYVLHLIKLIGRTTPIMIAHSKQKPVSNSSSKNVIHAFNQFEKTKWGTVSIHLFTAISTYDLMHEDICTLALDKLTSLIIIPLHRKWSIHEYIESEDKNLRALNRKVLEKAPCSVGIFFDRGGLGHYKNTSSDESHKLQLCMFFFGGKDDREALTLAKRMSRDANAFLTVIHFVAKDIIVEIEDRIVDALLLDDVKRRAKNVYENVEYIERVVRDGQETLAFVRQKAKLYDLFIAGRRYEISCPQTAGLAEWSEIPELGVIGDYLASKDLETRASVLVVQQQKQIKRLQ
ncbi:cation/H(+) antiporter 9-like [Mercurialis annua]|uniref:cation/H(+) antiporter 9-like n=1 Tax=Mercurialis annua TaxID=3986 RepID=UPI00215E54A7|nr:cation/H(+) antiporter 9-like [Mercurialis annua]